MEDAVKNTSVAPVSPNDIIETVVDYFLSETEGFEGHATDPFGEIPLGHLTELLYRLHASTLHWHRVAHFALNKANCFGFYYYTPTLLSVSPHVSCDTRELIVAHFVKHGDIDNVAHITATQLHRKPTQEEVMVMAEYHHKRETSSENEAWSTLCKFADEANFERIKKMRNNVFYRENNESIFDIA